MSKKRCPFKKVIVEGVGNHEEFAWCNYNSCMAYCEENDSCMLIQRKSEFNFIN